MLNNYDEIYPKTLESFGGDELAASVFLKKYANNDGVNYQEATMDDLRDRLSKEINDVEKRFGSKTYDFRDLLNRFLPGGRICYGLGNKLVENSTLSNCYVLPAPTDSLESIFNTASQQARIFSRGGGVGFDVSKLRPVNAKVNNVALTSTGAVSFMDLYSMVTGLISQNSRRGALMLTMDCHHPDLIEFIKVKGGNDKTKVQYANVSVRITDDFMQAVESNSDWTMKFVTEHGDEIVKTEKAKDIWDLLVESNWNGAEPGILFWDAITSSPASSFQFSKPISTNPCVPGETFLTVKNIDDTISSKKIEDLVNQNVTIWNGYEWSDVTPVITGTNQEILKIKYKFTNNYTPSWIDYYLKCTKYHGFYLKNNPNKIQAKDLVVGDIIEDYTIPVFDGSYKMVRTESIVGVEIESIELLDDIEPVVYCLTDKKRGRVLFNGIMTGNCGEMPLPAYGSCNLGSMVFSKYVIDPFTENARFDFEQFRKDVKLAARFMSNVNIINKDRQPLPENREMIVQTNAIGIGFTALADTLIMMNLKYDTDDAIEFTKSVVRELKESTVLASIELAKERGSFKLLSTAAEEERKSYITHPYFKFLERPGLESALLDFHTYGTHNIQFNTVAPNGTISIVLQSSSGLEPIFCTEYDRTVMTGDVDRPKKFTVYHPLVKIYESTTGKSYKDNPNFVTAEQIDWKMRVKMQAVIQESISESISSTINLPNNVTKETISGIYLEAWKLGLKGATIYRDGSRGSQVLKKTESTQQIPICEHVKFPDSTDAKMRVIKSEGKKWYVSFTLDHETKLPNSLFVNTNSTETNVTTTGVLEELRKLALESITERFVIELDNKITHQSNVVKTARFLSLLLRHRVPIIEIIRAIENANIPFTSFAYRIKGLLAEFVEGKITGDDCPECKSKMVFQNGCKMCQNCGFSKCG